MAAAHSKPSPFVIRQLDSPGEIAPHVWDSLVAGEDEATPFMRHAYLAAMHESASATPATGWTPLFLTAWQGEQLQAACALYLKEHSYGEYVFDWAWASAYEQHGLTYYPKGLVASPFTPVPGARLLARNEAARAALLQGLLSVARQLHLSSLHLLFLSAADLSACRAAGLMLRQTVQFHWRNAGYRDFDAFLGSLAQDKRKKIRQERRKVAEAGVSFRASQGAAIRDTDWDFFYRCYERTYREHGNPPYLTRDFFRRTARDMPEHWLLFVAERQGRPVASSLIALGGAGFGKVAYGRYWGAVERVDCLHFEACYYQPLAWCIEHGYDRFEGGAQGEHKMARALMPVPTHSAHWLAHPAFADAVERFLVREGEGVQVYLEHLAGRSPFRTSDSD
jgi:predicted N-acyltransferase